MSKYLKLDSKEDIKPSNYMVARGHQASESQLNRQETTQVPQNEATIPGTEFTMTVD